MAKKTYKIPFDKEGNQLEWADDLWMEGVVWREPEIFEDELEFERYSRGRSAATFHLKRKSNGASVTMFMSTFTESIPFMVKGKIKGKFEFIKRGTNYGCKLIGGRYDD